MKMLSKRGQSTGEYAILFAIVLGAVFAVQNYIRNRVAGSIKDSVTAHYFNGTSACNVTITQRAETEQKSGLQMDSLLKGEGDAGSQTYSATDSIPD